MKTFLIFAESASKNDGLLSLISAFTSLESVGVSDDMIGALDHIRERCPDLAIFDESFLDRIKRYDFFEPIVKERRGSVVILPKDYELRKKCRYVGMDFPVGNAKDVDWLISSIRHVLREYRTSRATCSGEGPRGPAQGRSSPCFLSRAVNSDD